MPSMRTLFIGMCLSAGALSPARAADNPPLDVKPGLWEMTSDSERSGKLPLPPEALARMTPEQRAKLEAAMQGSMGPRHRVVKRCVTQADIDKGFEEMERIGHGRCTQNVASSTPTLREGSFSCAAPQNASGHYRFEARSPEAVVGNWEVTVNGGDNAMNVKVAMHGKWLGSDCGSVKPNE